MVTKCKIMHSSDSLMSWFQLCPLWQAVVCWVMKFACLSYIQQITGNSSLVHWYGRVSKHGLDYQGTSNLAYIHMAGSSCVGKWQ